MLRVKLLWGTMRQEDTTRPSRVGYSLPFVLNLLTNTFLTISNVLIGTNTPTSPTSGDWQPPHAEAIGAYVLISHPGFNGVGNNFYGAVNLAAYTSPAKQILLTSGSTWTVPSDWNNSSNSITAIGAGAAGTAGGNGGAGGSGNPGTIGGNGGSGGRRRRRRWRSGRQGRQRHTDHQRSPYPRSHSKYSDWD